MAVEFTIGSFVGRWFMAIALVLGTYNPSDYSYVGWVMDEYKDFGPLMALLGVALVIAWIVFLRATMFSLGFLGVVLWGALFGCVIWWLIRIGVLSLNATGTFTWIVLFVLSFILAVGMSWSHIRRRLTGQFIVDEKDG